VTEIWFYHLERRSLVEVLPTLLERSLQRGWRAVVQAGSPERVAALDTLLWTYADESFLPHGTAGDGDAESQPIFLTQGETTPNGAAIRFMLDGASIGPILATEGHAYQRLMLLFDGRDDEAVAAARAQWSALKKDGRNLSYWQQDEDGRWEKRG
jgi:DNA polymerase-3 subunit chi